MGLFDRLFGGRFTLPPPDEAPMSAAILRELSPVSPEQKKAMKAFTQALLARMSEAERTRLTHRVMRRFATGDGAATVFVGAASTREKDGTRRQVVRGVLFARRTRSHWVGV